jgi:hypothetical protein
MSTKGFIWLGLIIGGIIGGWLGSLMGGGMLGWQGIAGNTVGSLVGIFIGYKCSQYM